MAGRQTTKTAPAKRRRGRPAKKKESFLRVFFGLLMLSWFGRVFLVSLSASLVLAVNLLISRSRYETFFLLTGVELIVVALIKWSSLIFKRD